MGLPVVRGLVHVDPAGAHRVGEAQALLDVAREDGGEEAVRGCIRELDRLLERVDCDDGSHRPERLLPRDERVCGHAVEDRRLPVQLRREALRTGAAAAELRSAIAAPTTAPGPVTRLRTPGGRSASATHSASATAAIAVVEAGVQTTVFPQASAGAISSAGIVYGQFHGVMTPITPRGRRQSSTRFPGE